MNNYRSNNRKHRFKSNNDRNFRKRLINPHKNQNEFNSNIDFRHRNSGRNNHNAAKLIDKYNDLAREASSNGDKILSENYLQHADHFTRVLNEKEIYRREKLSENKSVNREADLDEVQTTSNETSENEVVQNSEQNEISNNEKPQVEVN